MTAMAVAEVPGRRPGPVLDTETAREFMRQTLARIPPAELEAMAGELEVKHRRFRARLTGGAAGLGADGLRPLLRSIFATRRRVAEVLARATPDRLGAAIDELLLAPGPAGDRLQAFGERLAGLPAGLSRDLGGELLHYTAPERHWLWTRWIWDPATRTGALPLVTTEEHDLDGGAVGETYLRVGRAIAFVHETGRAAGFAGLGPGPFGVDVYLACVYGIYVYAALELKMTREFTRGLPPLAGLCRRLLGVYRMEV